MLPDDAQDTIDTLHDKGKVVVCYISIGSVEEWRYDFEDFPEEAVGKPLEGWEGERWLDINNQVIYCPMVVESDSIDKHAITSEHPDVDWLPGRIRLRLSLNTKSG